MSILIVEDAIGFTLDVVTENAEVLAGIMIRSYPMLFDGSFTVPLLGIASVLKPMYQGRVVKISLISCSPNFELIILVSLSF